MLYQSGARLAVAKSTVYLWVYVMLHDIETRHALDMTFTDS